MWKSSTAELDTFTSKTSKHSARREEARNLDSTSSGAQKLQMNDDVTSQLFANMLSTST